MTVHDTHSIGMPRISPASGAPDISDAQLLPTDSLHRAVHAALRTLRDAAMDAADLDAIVYAVERRQVPLRWQSARVACALGAREDVAAFDVPGARAAWSMAMALRTPDEPLRRVLVIEAEGTGRPYASLISD